MPPPSREKSIAGVRLFSEHQRRRFFSKTKRAANGCLEWTACVFKANGYGQFGLWDPKEKKRWNFVAHRLLWEATNGLVAPGLLVLHRCDNRTCVLLDHMFVGTTQDNTADMVSKNRQAKGLRSGAYTKPESRLYGDRNGSRRKPETRPRGEASGMSKMSDEQVREIRWLYSEGWHQEIIAEYFGMVQSTISSIVRRETWKHLS
jgi:hypothetical protein